MRLRSGSPWKCGGLKKDADQDGPRVLSAAITPRGSSQARPRPDALKRGAEGRRVWLVNAGKGLVQAGGAGRTEQHRSRRAPAYRRGAPTPCWNPCPSILSALVHHPATTTPLFIFFAPSYPTPHDRSIHPHPQADLLTAVLLQPLPALGSPVAPPDPARPWSPQIPAQTGGEGREDNPQRCAAAPPHAWAGRGSDPAPSA